ncbi:MAG: hypothetical protein RIS45_1551 [Planctomycetota bacterium]
MVACGSQARQGKASLNRTARIRGSFPARVRKADRETSFETAGGIIMQREATGPAHSGEHGMVRIVVAIDFSQPSMRALDWAEALAEGRPSSIVAVHAIEPTPLAHMAEAADALIVRAEERVSRVCVSIARKGIPIEPYCAVGRPWSVVNDAVRQRGADLVILGNRGLSPIKRTLLGSNADRILRAVSAPALVVHASDAPRGHIRVLVATDFSQDSEDTIAAFRRIFVRSSVRLDVRVLHATVPPEVIESVDVPLVERFDWESLEVQAQQMVHGTAAVFRADGIDTTEHVVRGGASRAILAEGRGWRADLLVLGRRGSSGFERFILGSTAERVMHSAPCAVFTAQRARVPAARATPVYIS